MRLGYGRNRLPDLFMDLQAFHILGKIIQSA
jgi:hypothetical protein